MLEKRDTTVSDAEEQMKKHPPDEKKANVMVNKCPYCGAAYPVGDYIFRCPLCGGDLKSYRTALADRRDGRSEDDDTTVTG